MYFVAGISNVSLWIWNISWLVEHISVNIYPAPGLTLLCRYFSRLLSSAEKTGERRISVTDKEEAGP